MMTAEGVTDSVAPPVSEGTLDGATKKLDETLGSEIAEKDPKAGASTSTSGPSPPEATSNQNVVPSAGAHAVGRPAPQKERRSQSSSARSGGSSEIVEEGGGEGRRGGGEKDALLPGAAASAASPGPSVADSWGSWSGWGAALSVVSAIQEQAAAAAGQAAAAAKEVLVALEEVQKVPAEGDNLLVGDGQQQEHEDKQHQQEPQQRHQALDTVAGLTPQSTREVVVPAVSSSQADVVAHDSGRAEASGAEGDRGDEAARAGTTSAQAATQQESESDDTSAADTSMESVELIASNALQALGSAWTSGLSFMQTLEQSAGAIAKDIQDGRLPVQLGPSILESGADLAAQGLNLLEQIGKETAEIIAAETGIELEKDEVVTDHVARGAEGGEGVEEKEDIMGEDEASFDRCFYIYGGPEHLEELEALADHYTVLCIRARGKLVGEDRAAFDARLKSLQAILALSKEGAGASEEDVSRKAGASTGGDIDREEWSALLQASKGKATEMTHGFMSKLGAEQSIAELEARTVDRLEALRVEAVHRISELCAMATLHLLHTSNDLVASTKATTDAEDAAKGDAGGTVRNKIWPDDCEAKGRVVADGMKSMVSDLDDVAEAFLTGIEEIMKAATGAEENSTSEGSEGNATLNGAAPSSASGAKASKKKEAVLESLRSDQESATSKLEESLHLMPYIVLSTSLPA